MMYCSRRNGGISDPASGSWTSLFLRSHYSRQRLFAVCGDEWDLLLQQPSLRIRLRAWVVNVFHRRVYAIVVPYLLRIYCRLGSGRLRASGLCSRSHAYSDRMLDSLRAERRKRGNPGIEDNRNLLLVLRMDVCCWWILICRHYSVCSVRSLCPSLHPDDRYRSRRSGRCFLCCRCPRACILNSSNRQNLHRSLCMWDRQVVVFCRAYKACCVSFYG